MKFANWKKPERNAQLSEEEINELISTANNKGISHQVPGQPGTEETKEPHSNDTRKDELARERRYEDD